MWGNCVFVSQEQNAKWSGQEQVSEILMMALHKKSRLDYVAENVWSSNNNKRVEWKLFKDHTGDYRETGINIEGSPQEEMEERAIPWEEASTELVITSYTKVTCMSKKGHHSSWLGSSFSCSVLLKKNQSSRKRKLKPYFLQEFNSWH